MFAQSADVSDGEGQAGWLDGEAAQVAGVGVGDAADVEAAAPGVADAAREADVGGALAAAPEEQAAAAEAGGVAVLAPPAIADVAPGRVPDPTPPPPPPPPVARPADRRRRGREDVEAGWERWVLPDGRGELVYNPIDNSLAAHCHDARHWRCRLNRTCNRLRMRPAQGRPIGQLVAWLFDAARHESREAHFNARREEVVIDWSTRSRARAWFRENCPDSAAAFAKERPMGDDSRDEPIGVPG